MATLVKRIKHSSRGKDKGFAWQVELDLPSVQGTTDAAIIGGMASTEIVSAIRSNWLKGKNVSGEQLNVSEESDTRRKIKAALIALSDYDAFRDRVARDVGSGKDFPWRFVPGRAKYAPFRAYYLKRQGGEMVDGEIGKKRVRRMYTPKPSNPGINASGLMVDALRGKRRKGRTMVINGEQTAISDHVELRLPKKRQKAGAFIGGLSQARADRMADTFRHMPQTEALLNQCANWQQFGEVSTSLFVAARLILMAVRLLGSV